VKPTGQASSAALSISNSDNLRLFIPIRGCGFIPFRHLSWVLLYKSYDDGKKAKAIHDLFEWCLKDGQSFAAGAGIRSFAPDISAKALAASIR